MKATIHEVLQYGPICASDEELDFLVTVNGAYINLWVPAGDGRYHNADCKAMPQDLMGAGLYGCTGDRMIDLAKEALEEWLSEGESEGEEED